MRETRLVNGFAEKILVLGKWDIFGQKFHNSGSAQKLFFLKKKKFLHIEKVQEVFFFYGAVLLSYVFIMNSFSVSRTSM